MSFVLTFFFSSFLLYASISGKANLDKSDLEPALKALKERLMTKNVVCSSCSSTLFLLPYMFANYLSAIVYPMKEANESFVIWYVIG